MIRSNSIDLELRCTQVKESLDERAQVFLDYQKQKGDNEKRSFRKIVKKVCLLLKEKRRKDKEHGLLKLVDKSHRLTLEEEKGQEEKNKKAILEEINPLLQH